METDRLDRRRAALALAALLELKEALQQAHFAARNLEELMTPTREDRPSDRIHALRTAAEHLARDIQGVIGSYREVDLRPADAAA